MELPELTETITAAKAGSADGYGALLEVYGPRLFGYFYRATGDHHDAEDLLGEMAVKLVRQLKNYDERGRFEPWLFRIAANMVRDRIRRVKVRPRAVSLSFEDDQGRAFGDRLGDEGRAVDQGLLARETSEHLQEALGRLDDRTREMILLRYFGEISFRELADRFDCPLGTVLAKVHRGLKALRGLLSDDEHD